MAFHLRRQIRDAVVAALKGLPTTGDNVFPGRTWPIPPELETSLLVYLEGGPSRLDSMGRGMGDTTLSLLREEKLAIRAIVRTTGHEPEDVLHQIAAEVEPPLMANGALGGLVIARELVNTEISAHAQGNDRVGEMKLTYSLTVRTSAGDPTQVL